MSNIKKVDHIGIRVAQKERAINFYQEFGYKPMFDGGFEKGHPVIMQHPSGLVLNLLGPAVDQKSENVLMDIDKKYAGYTHVAFEIESAEQTEAFLAQLNIAITGRHQYKGIKSLFIRDPDMNVLELVERTGPEFFADVNNKHHL